MSNRLRVFSSSVGTKVLIAVTGLALVGFLILHLAGNLLVFAGPDVYNTYSQRLVSNPLIIPAELGLVAIFLAHVYKSVRMWLEGQRARPAPYARKAWAGHTSRKSIASSTMVVSGTAILLFLVLHLKTFKFGAHYQATDTETRDLYRLVLEVFSEPAYVGFYVLSMALVGLHLGHGIASAFQSLGVDHPRVTQRLLTLGTILAVVIGGGFALIPLWIHFVW